MLTLRVVVDLASTVNTEIEPGKWVPARPLRVGFISRCKDAWLVLTDKADALVWPGGQ